jgi:alkylation response protein AidB-like acyl-CoA dehydrogenase
MSAMGTGLRALTRAAGTRALAGTRARSAFERIVHTSTKNGFRSASAASRAFKAAQRLPQPARQAMSQPQSLFDITPDEEQQMLQEAIAAFAAEKVRQAARDADAACATPPELLAEADELGVSTMGIPEELGGVLKDESAVTSVLVAQALAHGDMGIAYATLAPGAVATALGRWGDSDQQATYLPPFTSDEPPAAALALLERRPLFDPRSLETKARREGADWVLSGTKSLLARAAECELFAVAADAQDLGPALFIVESSTAGLSIQPEPAMGLRAASTGALHLDSARVPATALLAEGAPAAYAECVERARIAWCGLALGTCEAVRDYVVPYVNQRSAFGEPISNRQAVAFTVADMGIETEGLRLLTYRAAARADAGADFSRDAALAHRLCAAKAMRIASDGVQLLGGHGYVKDHPVERWYRDARAAALMQGALLV